MLVCIYHSLIHRQNSEYWCVCVCAYISMDHMRPSHVYSACMICSDGYVHSSQQYIHINTHAGVWTHVVWTISRSTPTATTGTHRAYINGALKVSASGNFARVVCTSNYIAKSNFPDAGYVGSIDSLAIYPWVLGALQATAVFESTGALVCMSVP
jgi:hypothetical protein